MRSKKRAVTIQDVAREAGVSVSTVSRILNRKDDVAVDTYERVQGVIDRLGYTSSLAARGMRGSRTNVIGLIMPDVSSPYCVEVMQGVNYAIARSNYDMLVYTTGDVRKYGTAEQERKYVVLLNGSITDGVIVVTPVATDFATGAPLVAVDPNNESPNCPAVVSTNLAGAMDAMAYLISLGHRRIGFITGRLELVSGTQRLQGYKDGLAAAGLPLDEALIQVGDFTTETALQCARNLLTMADRPSAIFAANDMSAMGVYRVARELGIRIPQDLSVVGFDNLKESSFLVPALTTVDQFLAEMGMLAFDILKKLVNGESLEQTLYKVPTHLLIRDSCQPLSVP